MLVRYRRLSNRVKLARVQNRFQQAGNLNLGSYAIKSLPLPETLSQNPQILEVPVEIIYTYRI